VVGFENQSDLLDIIQLIYAGVSSEFSRKRTVKRIVSLLSSESIALLRIDTGSKLGAHVISSNMSRADRECLSVALAPCSNPDPESNPFNNGLKNALACPDSILMSTVNLKDGQAHCLACAVEKDKSGSLILAFTRPESKDNFSDKDSRNLAELMPHLRNAFDLSGQLDHLRSHTNAFETILDHAPFAIMLVNSQARILYRNLYASNILKAEDGIRIKDGGLIFDSERNGEKFTDFLQEACPTNRAPDAQHTTHIMAVERLNGNKALQLTVMPAQQSKEVTTPLAYAVFIYEPNVHMPIDTDALRQFEGLTPAEARLCESIYATKNLSETAENLNVSVSTAKTHLLNTFRKLNVNSQAELMRYLAHMPKHSMRIPQHHLVRLPTA
jgi:DNA-binding CsgD family transcriptional regulator